MPDLFIYLIKANIALTLFYLAYRFGLRRLTFYTLNRYFLLLGIACSALFPLIDFRVLVQTQEQLAADSIIYYTPDWNALQQSVSSSDPYTIWSLLEYVFWTGVAVMFIRFIIQLISLLRIHLQSTSGEINKEKVRLISGKMNPFSFFKNTYINPSLHSKEEFYTILAHEKIHIRQWHSLDVLAGELNHIFYWFNPGAWLMKNAIRENLEFITDRALLRSGINAKKYQYSLLKTTTDLQVTQLANNFNLSHLKKRIVMMNKKRSSKRHLLRYLLLVPATAAIAIIVSSSRAQDIQTKPQNTVKSKVDALNKIQDKDTIPLSKKHIPTDYKSFLKQNPSVERMVWTKTKNGKAPVAIIHLKNGKTETYHLLDSTEMKAATAKYGQLPSPPPPSPPAPAKPKVKYTPPKVAPDSPAKPTNKKDYYLAQRGFEALKQKDLLTAEVYANKALKINPNNETAKQTLSYIKKMKAYNQKMKEYRKKKKEYKTSKGKVQYVPPKSIEEYTNNPPHLDTTLNLKNALLIIDGKEVNREKLKNIKGENIRNITVLKDESAISEYGDKGKNGAIIIETKKIAESNNNNLPKNALYIINDKEVSRQNVKNLNPDDIYSINVLKDKKAAVKYGAKGKYGVIKIFTKAYAKKHPKQFKTADIPDK